MNRADLQTLSKLRLREAKTLLSAGHHAGAYYLAGYSIECALKACIAKLTRRSAFPNKKLAERAHSHSLDQLVHVAGLQPALEKELQSNPAFQLNWQVVKDWRVESRYEVEVTQAAARDIISACGARSHGVLTWVKARW